MLRKICQTEISSQFHQSHKKIHLLINIFYMYMVKPFPNVVWWRFVVPCSESLLISSATLLRKTWNISTFSMLVCYKIQMAFIWDVSHISTDLFSSLIKVLNLFVHNFFIFKFHPFMFLINFTISKYSFFRRIIYLWYQYFQIMASSWSVSSSTFPLLLWLGLLWLHWGLCQIYFSSLFS